MAKKRAYRLAPVLTERGEIVIIYANFGEYFSEIMVYLKPYGFE